MMLDTCYTGCAPTTPTPIVTHGPTVTVPVAHSAPSGLAITGMDLISFIIIGVAFTTIGLAMFLTTRKAVNEKETLYAESD